VDPPRSPGGPRERESGTGATGHCVSVAAGASRLPADVGSGILCAGPDDESKNGAARMLGGLDVLIPATVTEVVFVFLCSKPLFVAAAMMVGILAHRRARDERIERLPDRS